MTGETRAITALAKDAQGNEIRGQRLVWTVEDATIAGVNASGIVTGIASGSTQLSVSAGGVSALVPVVVKSRPTSVISVMPASSTIRVGTTVTLTATAYDNAGGVVKGRPIKWKSSDASKATVDSLGVVTGVGPGLATITATIDAVSDASAVAVQSLPVASIKLSPTKASVQIADTTRLVAHLYDASGAELTGRLITWTSSNAGIASVSSAGLVTGAGLGQATITATSEGKNAKAKVTVSLFGFGSISSR